jgi:CRISPR/Cas system CSM-associated protein Csm3 (group 7 of RAMP superfamily)
MNPYGFVRLAGNPIREKVQQHEKYSGLSGWITCTLTTRTPVFVPQYRAGSADRVQIHETLKMYRDRQGTPLIPGTSLKGVIRNVAEAVSNSCFSLPNPWRAYRQKETEIEYDLPRDFHACENEKLLCPACRLFGMLNRGVVYAGNVSIQDAHARSGYQFGNFTLAILDAPKPRHRPFYSQKPEERKPPIRGRKFYRHRPQGVLTRSQKDHHNKTVEAVLPGAVFSFDVEYANLSEPDLNLLLFALTLWDDTCHKVGMGKPIGMGSAKIEITAIAPLDRQVRYRELGGGQSKSLTGSALADFITPRVAHFRAGTALNLEDLHAILRWDENAKDVIHYPGQDWFKANPKTPLEEAP